MVNEANVVEERAAANALTSRSNHSRRAMEAAVDAWATNFDRG
jgi:hypothetical protein